MKNKVVTRFAPSPTGKLHIGRARTALFSYLYAKKNGGDFLLRIEDTDKERSMPEFETDIIESLKWLGLNYDNEPLRQSERTDVYKSYIEKLISEDKAYISEETEGKNKEVIRFRNPGKEVTFTDMIRGDITFDTTELGDFIIARNIEEPLYHLTVVIDDHEMGVTNIVRGEDGISNTPRQILLQEAIGAERPKYAHVPMILAPDKTKLSGRHGAVGVSEYKEAGYFKETIINYLALLGWNPGTDQEIFSIDELIDVFDISKIQKGGATFNIEKLQWFNKEYLNKKSIEEIKPEILKHVSDLNIPEDMIDKLIPEILERISVYNDIEGMKVEGDFDFYTEEQPEYDTEKIIWKQANKDETLDHLNKILEILKSHDDFSSSEKIKEVIWPYAEEKGKGNVLWPMRYSLSGKDRSPDPFQLAYILDKDITLERISYAIEKLQK